MPWHSCAAVTTDPGRRAAVVRAWPAVAQHDRVGIRPLRMRDAAAWSEVRVRNQVWLEPWEGAPSTQAPAPWASRHGPAVFAGLLRHQRREARAGRAFPFAVTYDDRLVGQVNVGMVVRGAYDGGTIGYWVDRQVAGRGVTPVAVALVVDHVFEVARLHRVEANVRPENTASLRVVDKLGFRPEGRRERYLFIDGAWRDHLSFALVRDDVPEGLLRRLVALGQV